MRKILLVFFFGVGLALGTTFCRPRETQLATPNPPSEEPSTMVGQPQPTDTKKQPEHRLSVRQVNGVGEFYNVLSDETFIPRGVNYAFVPQGAGYTNLVLKVGVYDPQHTRDDFNKLADLGYNTARVFIDHCSQGAGCIGDSDNVGLNPDYLDNIADMMAAARETGIYLLFTSNDLPDQGGYSDEANSGSDEKFAGYRNSYYLRPQAITATRRYWRDLLTGLVERDAAFDSVLGWQLLNEQWMFRDQPPLSLTSGLVETTTGTYDMSDPGQKNQMVSDGIIYYIAQMKAEILLHDPTALVTMGFFVPEIVAPDWYVETTSLLEKSELDFFDFHAYPGGPSFQDHAEHFGMIDYTAKPIILGEYGPFRHIYPEIDSAARVVSSWVSEACQFGFDGWLYWSYYPSDVSAGDRTWGLVDDNDYLLDLFAPVNQPDPCQAVEIPNNNLAYNKPVTASLSLADQHPTNAVDDNAGTQWGAGADPIQWIEVDLQGVYQITEIRLLVAQYPVGNTIHNVQVRASATDTYQTVYTFDDSTSDNDWLVFMPDTPLENINLIRIQTISSPSWVAWKEIKVYGESIQP